MKKELVISDKWSPEQIRWDHPKIIELFKNNYKNLSDKELAKRLSDLTGKNVTELKARTKRLELGLKRKPDRSAYGGGGGGASKLDWESKEVKRFIQKRYHDMDDIKLAEALGEHFNVELAWPTVRKRRTELGYCREGRSKQHAFDLDTREKRRFIYLNHPEYGGRCDSRSQMAVGFKKKFDVPNSPHAIMQAIERFIENDELQNTRYVGDKWMDIPVGGKIKRFF